MSTTVLRDNLIVPALKVNMIQRLIENFFLTAVEFKICFDQIRKAWSHLSSSNCKQLRKTFSYILPQFQKDTKNFNVLNENYIFIKLYGLWNYPACWLDLLYVWIMNICREYWQSTWIILLWPIIYSISVSL